MRAESEGLAERDDGLRRERLIDQTSLFGLVDDGCNSTGVESVAADCCIAQSLSDLLDQGPVVTGNVFSVLRARYHI